MVAIDLSPTTREEIDDFFGEVVRARLNHLLANPYPSLILKDQPRSVPVAPHHTMFVAGAVPTQDPQGHTCAFCQTDGRDQTKVRPDLCPSKDDIDWLDCRIRNALTISFAKERYHSDSPHPTPQGWVDWYQQFFNAVIGISVLGAGFTFSVVFNDFASDEEPRTALGAAWMLFVVSIGITSGASLLVHMHRAKIAAAMELEMARKERWWHSPHLSFVTIGTLFIQMLPLGAFLASAKAIMHYQKAIGIASLVVILLYGLVLLRLWVNQNTIGFKKLAERMLCK